MATFGKTGNGTTSFTSSTDKIAVSPAIPATSGTVASAVAQIWMDTAGSTNSKFVIYADSSGAPGALLAESGVVNFSDTTANSERSYTFSGANLISITGGTQYWIGVAWQDPGTPSIRVSRDNTNTTNGRHEQSGAGFSWPTLPSTYGTPTLTSGGPISASVTYTESGGGGGTTPVVRSASSDGQANSPTATATKPTGLAVGDYLLAFHESDADGALASMTAPAGFVEVSSQAPTAGTNIPAGKVWGKVADSSDVAASTFAFPDATGSNCSVVLLAIQAGTYDTTTPVTTPAWATQGNAADANITAPTTTGALNALLLTGHLAETGGTLRAFTSGPAGMTLTHQSTAGGATYTRIAVYQQSLSSAGATGAKTAVLAATPSGWIATALTVNPAPAAGGGTAQRTGGFLSLLG